MSDALCPHCTASVGHDDECPVPLSELRAELALVKAERDEAAVALRAELEHSDLQLAEALRQRDDYAEEAAALRLEVEKAAQEFANAQALAQETVKQVEAADEALKQRDAVLAEVTVERDVARQQASQLAMPAFALVEAQAHVLELRVALARIETFCGVVKDALPGDIVHEAKAALAREPGTEALREFGLRVGQAIVFEPPTSTRDSETIVDAVLKGES